MRAKRFARGMAAVLLAVIAVGGIGVAIFAANSGNGADMIYCGNTPIKGDTVVEVKSGQMVFFRVYDALGRPQDYTYTITPGQEVPELVFEVDGYKYPYKSETDLSAGVQAYVGRGQLVITVPGDMQEVLTAVYEGHTVTVPAVDMSNGAYFIVNITTARGQYAATLKTVGRVDSGEEKGQ